MAPPAVPLPCHYCVLTIGCCSRHAQGNGAAISIAAATTGMSATQQRELTELRGKCEKLEGMCQDLENERAAERTDFEVGLSLEHAVL